MSNNIINNLNSMTNTDVSILIGSFFVSFSMLENNKKNVNGMQDVQSLKYKKCMLYSHVGKNNYDKIRPKFKQLRN